VSAHADSDGRTLSTLFTQLASLSPNFLAVNLIYHARGFSF